MVVLLADARALTPASCYTTNGKATANPMAGATSVAGYSTSWSGSKSRACTAQ